MAVEVSGAVRNVPETGSAPVKVPASETNEGTDVPRVGGKVPMTLYIVAFPAASVPMFAVKVPLLRVSPGVLEAALKTKLLGRTTLSITPLRVSLAVELFKALKTKSTG